MKSQIIKCLTKNWIKRQDLENRRKIQNHKYFQMIQYGVSRSSEKEERKLIKRYHYWKNSRTFWKIKTLTLQTESSLNFQYNLWKKACPHWVLFNFITMGKKSLWGLRENKAEHRGSIIKSALNTVLEAENTPLQFWRQMFCTLEFYT